MRIIESNATFTPQTEFTIDGIWKHIERCGRICYKSEDRIVKDSHIRFVDMIVKRGHLAVLEHGTVYLTIPYSEEGKAFIKIFDDNPYSRVTYSGADSNCAYITTNYRVVIENGYTTAMKWICNPTEHHAKRITATITCDRGVSHELVRHRVFSFCQESTRYCNYSADKFGKHVTFIKPTWTERGQQETFNIAGIDFISEEKTLTEFLHIVENAYHKLIKSGQTPQEARAILPSCTKTDIAMTGFVDQWEAFFKLRCSPNAHPDMQKVAKQLEGEYNIMNRGEIQGDLTITSEAQQLLEEQVEKVNEILDDGNQISKE